MKKLLILTVVCAVALMATSAFAQSPLKAVGVELGFVDPEAIDGTWGLGAYMDFGFPGTAFGITPFVDWWSTSAEALGVSADFTDVAFGAMLKMNVPTAGPLSPWVGAGAAAHMLKSEFNFGGALSGLSGEVTDTKIGLHFGGGLNLNVSERMNLTGGVSYTTVEGFNQLWVKGGLALRL